MSRTRDHYRNCLLQVVLCWTNIQCLYYYGYECTTPAQQRAVIPLLCRPPFSLKLIFDFDFVCLVFSEPITNSSCIILPGLDCLITLKGIKYPSWLTYWTSFPIFWSALVKTDLISTVHAIKPEVAILQCAEDRYHCMWYWMLSSLSLPLIWRNLSASRVYGK